MSAVVATRYAKAIREIGIEEGILESLVAEIDRIARAYESSEELRNALDNPLLARKAKTAILSDVADRLAVGTTAKNTLLLLSDRRRLRVLPAIARRLRVMSDLSQGVVHAEVTTAGPLSEDYYARLKAQLEKMTGKRILLNRREDPTLLAGVIARIGDTVYDGSLKARLESLKNGLLPN